MQARENLVILEEMLKAFDATDEATEQQLRDIYNFVVAMPDDVDKLNAQKTVIQHPKIGTRLKICADDNKSIHIHLHQSSLLTYVVIISSSSQFTATMTQQSFDVVELSGLTLNPQLLSDIHSSLYWGGMWQLVKIRRDPLSFTDELAKANKKVHKLYECVLNDISNSPSISKLIQFMMLTKAMDSEYTRSLPISRFVTCALTKWMVGKSSYEAEVKNTLFVAIDSIIRSYLYNFPFQPMENEAHIINTLRKTLYWTDQPMPSPFITPPRIRMPAHNKQYDHFYEQLWHLFQDVPKCMGLLKRLEDELIAECSNKQFIDSLIKQKIHQYRLGFLTDYFNASYLSAPVFSDAAPLLKTHGLMHQFLEYTFSKHEEFKGIVKNVGLIDADLFRQLNEARFFASLRLCEERVFCATKQSRDFVFTSRISGLLRRKKHSSQRRRDFLSSTKRVLTCAA